MENTIAVDTPDSTDEVQVKSVEQRKAELVESRRARLTGDDGSTEEEEVDGDEPEIEEPEVDGDEDGDEDGEAKEGSGLADEIDIDSLTEDDIREIAKLKGIDLDPKENKAWAVQRKKVKELEEKVQLAEQATKEALSIHSTSEAEKQVSQVEANIKYWNRKLMLESENQYDGDAEVRGVTHDGKFFSAEQILNFVDEEEKKLPTLRKAASEAESLRAKADNIDEVIDEVREKFNLDGESLEAFDKMLSSPRFEVIKKLVPDFSVELVELFGLASLQQGNSPQKKTIKRKAPQEIKTSSSPKSGSARPANTGGKSQNLKKLNAIANDSKQTVAARLEARKQMKLLKYQ